MSNNGKEPNGNNKPVPLKTLAGAEDKPLKIGDIEIPCYVLEDETRVISQRGLYGGLKTTGGGHSGAALDSSLMPRIAQAKWLEPYISPELRAVLSSPIEFVPPHGGRTAYGYPAKAFVDLCEAILKARDNRTFASQQEAIIMQADLIMRGLALVGITALIDEATGYQEIRVKRALALILEKYLADELQAWIKTFPMEFYEEICRLNKWPKEYAINRPAVVDHYTNDLIYERLAPGVLEELRARNPVITNGNRKHKHHQWLTRDHGHPELQKHIEGVIVLMRISKTWDEFKRNLEKAYPKPVEALPLFKKTSDEDASRIA
ncbi:MAG: P63C domain-containing protein [Chloroflexi bacterium]|nr:P63C domain-containing protein [Chloroflexota bacterium]